LHRLGPSALHSGPIAPATTATTVDQKVVTHDGQAELDHVRRELGRLVGSRLLAPFSASDNRWFDELARREVELLDGEGLRPAWIAPSGA
jgi:hypothetical protein